MSLETLNMLIIYPVVVKNAFYNLSSYYFKAFLNFFTLYKAYLSL